MEKDNRNRAEKLPAAAAGNASNPSGEELSMPQEDSQLLSTEAEKYLRESANIEDMPDEQDWQEADRTLRDGQSQE